MKPEAQRIAIAEACGWHIREDGPFKYLCPSGEDKGAACGLHLSAQEIYPLFFTLDECGPDYVIPDYLNDLNAMHEAEKVLLNSQRRAYGEMLIRVHPLHYDPTIRREDENLNDNYMKLFLIANMPAAQRAEAFLRTLGKWEDSK